MVTEITQGIKISVKTTYRPDLSDLQQNKFVFSYNIYVENHNDTPVQLVSRHWNILEAEGNFREVDGEGVVGEKPVIQPNSFFQYESFSEINSEIGKMWGTYMMVDLNTHKLFEVVIPEFKLETLFKLN